MVDEIIKKFSKKTESKFFINYNLRKLNWFNIWGKTKFFFKPDNLNELVSFLKEFGKKIDIFILGAGSNILLNDRLYEGVVIKLGKNFSNITLMPNDVIVAGAAASDKNYLTLL